MYKERINTTLDELLPEGKDQLIQTARYSIDGGKRLRPLLVLSTLEAFEVPIERGLYPACAIELLHTYSLIHDDLPCMDDDDQRRNRPTLHKAFSETDAVLTGDYLLTYAFEVLGSSPHLTDQQKTALVLTLARRAGLDGMIGGQVIDIQGETLEMDALFDMYRKKSGALITASLEFGGIIAEQNIEPLQKIGDLLGLGFQIIDDLIDRDGVAEMLGTERAKQIAEALLIEAKDTIKKLAKPAPLLEDLADAMIFRTI